MLDNRNRVQALLGVLSLIAIGAGGYYAIAERDWWGLLLVAAGARGLYVIGTGR